MPLPEQRLPEIEPFEVRRPMRPVTYSGIVVVVLWCGVWLLGRWPAADNFYVIGWLFALPASGFAMWKLIEAKFDYVRVDDKKIEHLWFGCCGWSLPWERIRIRRAGLITGMSADTVLLNDVNGGIREFSVYWSNGQRLDDLVRWYLDLAGEQASNARNQEILHRAHAIQSERHGAGAATPEQFAEEMSAATLFRASPDTPTVRMKIDETTWPYVCCNCLKPATEWAAVTGQKRGALVLLLAAIGGSIGHVLLHEYRPLTIHIPLCAACRKCVSRNDNVRNAYVLAAIGLFVISLLIAGLKFLPLDPDMQNLIASVGLAGVILTVGLSIRESWRPAASALVQVRRFNIDQCWMEVAIGNPDYSRLLCELNQIEHPVAAGQSAP